MRAGALAWLALALMPQPGSGAPSIARVIESAPGRNWVALDRDVYAGARPDLADLHIVDDRGQWVPFVIDRDSDEPVTVLRAEVLNQGFVPGRSATGTLDFGEKVRKSSLHVAVAGDNFRRRVAVEGSDDGRAFTMLVDDAWLFAIPGPTPARHERVALPEGDHRYLRVTVFQGAGERRVEIRELSAEGGRTQASAGMRLPVVLRRSERPKERETLLSLELPGARFPFRAVELEVATPRFLRTVAVEGQRVPSPLARDPAGAPREVAWAPLGESAIYRYESGGRLYEKTRLETSGRERMLRLRVRNLDDAPLDVVGALIVAPRERLLFEARAGRRYLLKYGDERAAPPSFDLGRTIGDPGAWAASAREARLAETRHKGVSVADNRPFTERHPGLLWGGLVFLTVALGWLTRRALRDA